MSIASPPECAVTRALLRDGALALQAEADVWPLVAPWVPRIPPAEPAPGQARAWIRARQGTPDFDLPAGDPSIELRSVAGWPTPDGRVLLCEPGRRLSAVVHPEAGRADVRLDLPDGIPEDFGAELMAGFTLAAAFLMGRLGRTLVHAGAIAAPDGRAWLLVGGTFSGKSTTCVDLIRAGWDYLADDHVIVGRTEHGVEVEGWPRRFNLDRGYAEGVSRGTRGRVDPDAFGPGRWVRAAPLGGVIFPRVEAELPTALSPVGAADALSGLLQQSPWLMADPGTAAEVLNLLRRVAGFPAFQLRLGADCYVESDALLHVLRPAVADQDDCNPSEAQRS
ncbi:MAG TPA: hypothetical protein VM759_00660 [Longimicrobium sp.]|nr:hypothetical protein [Longimicrobium sp.]